MISFKKTKAKTSKSRLFLISPERVDVIAEARIFFFLLLLSCFSFYIIPPYCGQVTYKKLQKISLTVTEVVLIQVSFLTVGSKQKNKTELVEYHGIFITFKSQVYSKQGSPFFSCLDQGV